MVHGSAKHHVLAGICRQSTRCGGLSGARSVNRPNDSEGVASFPPIWGLYEQKLASTTISGISSGALTMTETLACQCWDSPIMVRCTAVGLAAWHAQSLSRPDVVCASLPIAEGCPRRSRLLAAREPVALRQYRGKKGATALTYVPGAPQT